MGRMIHAQSPVRVRPKLCLLILFAGLFVSTESSAQEYPLRDVGGWTVAASQDKKGCFLTKVYPQPGRTTLLLGVDIDGSNRLSILNANWSIREKDRQSLTFRLSNASFPNHVSIGIASEGKKGFVTSFGRRFPAHFAASTFLHIFRGDVPVEQLSLDGSGAAVVELGRCVDLHREKPARKVRESGRADHIPIDPFAPDADRRSKK